MGKAPKGKPEERVKVGGGWRLVCGDCAAADPVR